MPEVAVVIPLYNKAATVLQAVRGALAQDCDLEVLVVDDGSTDGGAALLDGVSDPRLVMLRQENRGVSAARNRGILEARSPWIACLDADDRWDPDHLQTLLAAVGRRSISAAFSNVRLVARGGTLLPPELPGQLIEDYFSFALSHGGYPNMTSAMLLDRATAIDVGLFTVGVALGEDIDLWCRLGARGPMLYTGAATATYDDTPDPGAAARNRARRPEFPFFSASLPALVEDGAVPERLVPNARRYANFLLLEYARQLLDQGLNAEARRVLLEHCAPGLDPARFMRRLARTTALGRAAFAVSGRRSKAA